VPVFAPAQVSRSHGDMWVMGRWGRFE